MPIVLVFLVFFAALHLSLITKQRFDFASAESAISEYDPYHTSNGTQKASAWFLAPVCFTRAGFRGGESPGGILHTVLWGLGCLMVSFDLSAVLLFILLDFCLQMPMQYKFFTCGRNIIGL